MLAERRRLEGQSFFEASAKTTDKQMAAALRLADIVNIQTKDTLGNLTR